MIVRPDILQWNANSLKGPKRDQFIRELHHLNPSIVLLCETHWTDIDAIAMQNRLTSYRVIHQNGADGYGGVAIS